VFVGTTAWLRYSAASRSGARERVDIELLRESGEWKISAMRFPDE